MFPISGTFIIRYTYDQICGGESTLADAIMDRISYDSYKINIEYIDKNNDRSMREVYGMSPDEAQ